MKRLRIQRWPLSTSQIALSHSRAITPFCQRQYNHRLSSTQASAFSSSPLHNDIPLSSASTGPTSGSSFEHLPSPPTSQALKSAKLAALHARLSLPSRLPLQTLARTLVDPTADPSPDFNNSSLAVLGADLLGYYTGEHLICRYPRLPIEVLFAAQRAYVGPEALAAVTREWGVEPVAEPGGEVDPGFLQLRQEVTPGYQPGYHAQLREQQRQDALPEPLRTSTEREEHVSGTARPNESQTHWRKSISSRILYDDQFGAPQQVKTEASDELPTTTLDLASRNFVRALVGAIHLHLGSAATKTFFKQHFLSRTLDFSKLFSFKYSARDLSRLCIREGFEPPVARLISETGRLSSHPVFVVGVYSGRDKLGEGVGGSITEAKIRAATAALKGWYLYSPLEVVLPSEVEGGDKDGIWKPNLVDLGEIIT